MEKVLIQKSPVAQYVKKIGWIPLALLLLHLLNPFSSALITASVLLIYYLLLYKELLFDKLDLETILVTIFSISYSLFIIADGSQYGGIQPLVTKLFMPPFFYLLGKNLLRFSVTKNFILLLLLLLIVFFSLTTLISIVSDLMKNGFTVSILDRNIPDFWTGNQVLATGMSSFLLYNLTLPGIILLNRKAFNIKIIIILSAVFVTSLLCIFRLGSRTGIAVAGISLVIAITYAFVKQSLIQNIRFITLLVVLAILAYKFVPFDMDADYLSILGERLKSENTSSASSAGGRTELWENAFSKMFENPLGWKSEEYAHNLWLDTAKVVGIIPALFLFLFTLTNTLTAVKFSFDKNNEIELCVFFVLFTLVSMLLFFVEPIFEGSPFVFTFYCLVQGVQKQLWVSKKILHS